MSRRRGVMSDELKWEIAREMGFDNTLRTEGFGGVTSRNCGMMVHKAIEMAQRNLSAQNRP